MMRRVVGIVILLVTAVVIAGAQTPVITDVTPISAYPGSKVVITGSGFSSSTANLDVWFDNVKGTITSSSDFAIEVTVPVGAKTGNIQVINKASRLSAKSDLKFVPFYSGESLTAATAPSKFAATQQVTPVSTNEFFDVCTCDFDLDGKPDLAGTRTGTGAVDMTILRNTSVTPGTISFAATNTAMASAQTFNAACGDLNGDGKPDLVATRAVNNRNQIFVKENSSSGPGNINFIGPTILSTTDVNHVAFRPVIRDLNGDGKPEIIVSNAADSPGNSIYVFINQSTTSISINPTPLTFVIADASSSYGIDVQDLDGDAKPEIIVNQFNKPDFFVLKNTSVSAATATFATATKFSLGGALATLNHLTTADFNNDGKLDVAITNSTVNNKVHVMINTSTPSAITFTELGSFDTGDGAFGIDAGDVDGDRDIDIVVGNIDFSPSPANTEITILINTGASFSAVNLNTTKKSRNIKIADLDGDAKPEIIYTTVIGANGNSIDVLRNKNCFVPLITNPEPLFVCSGQTIDLATITNAGVTYLWSPGGATTSTLSITAAGTYSVQATSEAGTCTTSDAITVGVDASSVTQNPVITGAVGGVMTVCIGEALSLATSSVEPTYSWVGPNGFASNLQNPSVSPAATNEMGGLYQLELKNGVCRSNIATVRVDVVNLQSFVVGGAPPSGTVCQGSTVTLSTAVVGGHTYQWIKDGTGDISGQTSSTLAVTQEGSYRVRVTRTAEGCSTETTNFAAVFIAPPVVSFTAPAAACTGQAVTFTNTSQMDTRATASYSWNFGDGSPASTLTSPSHTYATAQNFTVVLTASYANVAGCSANSQSSVNVTIPVPPVITASASGICPGETITLSIPGTYTSVVWSTTATTSSISVTASGDYNVNAKDPNGCTTTASTTITARAVPEITITTNPDPPTIAPGQTVTLTAAGADTYSWTPSESLSDPLIANPVATPILTTEYTAVGTVTGGCSAEAKVTVNVLGDIQVTNVFSPNGDGVNDLWVVPGIEIYAECTVSIFDPQGSRIFEQKGYQNNWDGTFDGKIVPKGTYYYVIAGCPDKTPLNGHILVAY